MSLLNNTSPAFGDGKRSAKNDDCQEVDEIHRTVNPPETDSLQTLYVLSPMFGYQTPEAYANAGKM